MNEDTLSSVADQT